MKLLLDENLSDRIVSQIVDLYPGSSHVKQHGLVQTSDTVIWSFAAANDFVIVSKDSDFHQRSLLLGAPPKFVFLKVGNCPTSRITSLLRSEYIVKERNHDHDKDPKSCISGDLIQGATSIRKRQTFYNLGLKRRIIRLCQYTLPQPE